MFPDSNSRIQTVPYFPDFHFIVRETYLHLYLFKFQEYEMYTYEGWHFNSGNYLFTTDTK